MMHGIVVRNTGSWYTVKTDEGGTMQCKVKGNFRLRGIRSTNPVVIGDHVTILPGTDGTALIDSVDERKNYIIRKSINLSKQSHILAANIDQCFLIVTIAHPTTSTTFIDRFLATAEAYSIPVTIVFNKTDIYSADDLELLDGMINLYETIGYSCLKLSVLTGEGMDKAVRKLHGKVTLLSGNSGVGKSTFINYILPELNLRTADLSDAYDTGRHTTTFSEMYELPTADSYIIDTPGIKGFGTIDMSREEVGHYFKEIFRFSADCRFNNCTHTHEPGCAVLAALERHDISQSRYNSYLSILGDENEDKYRQGY